MQRAPHPSLARFVKSVWLSAPRASRAIQPVAREHMMPTGEMHLVFRLSGPAICIFDGTADSAGRQMGHAVVGGARAGYYAKEDRKSVV